MPSAMKSASSSSSTTVIKKNDKPPKLPVKAKAPAKKTTLEKTREKMTGDSVMVSGAEMLTNIQNKKAGYVKKPLTKGLTDTDVDVAYKILRNRFRGESVSTLAAIALRIAQDRKKAREQTGVVPESLKMSYGSLTGYRSLYYMELYGLNAMPHEHEEYKQGQITVNGAYLNFYKCGCAWSQIQHETNRLKEPINAMEGLAIGAGLLNYPLKKKHQIVLGISESNTKPDSKFQIFATDIRLKRFMSGEICEALTEEIKGLQQSGQCNVRQFLAARADALLYIFPNFYATALEVLDSKCVVDCEQQLRLLCRNSVGSAIFSGMLKKVQAACLPANIEIALEGFMVDIVADWDKVDEKLLAYHKKALCAMEKLMKTNENVVKNRKEKYQIKFFNMNIPCEATPTQLCHIIVYAKLKEAFWRVLPTWAGFEELTSAAVLQPDPDCPYLHEILKLPNPARLSDHYEKCPKCLIKIETARDSLSLRISNKTTRPSISTVCAEMEKAENELRTMDDTFAFLEEQTQMICNVRSWEIVQERLEAKLYVERHQLSDVHQNLVKFSTSDFVVYVEKNQLVSSWVEYISSLVAAEGALAMPSDLLKHSDRLGVLGCVDVDCLSSAVDEAAAAQKRPDMGDFKYISTWSFLLDNQHQEIVKNWIKEVVDEQIFNPYGGKNAVQLVNDDNVLPLDTEPGIERVGPGNDDPLYGLDLLAMVLKQ